MKVIKVFWISLLYVLILSLFSISDIFAQHSTLSPLVYQFVDYDHEQVALKNVTVIDGTGAKPLDGQTILLKGDRIEKIGSSEEVTIPTSAKVIDMDSLTIIPGFVMVHEHLFYPVGPQVYNNLIFSFPRLYLAGGATTIRTAGSLQPYSDLNLKKAIDGGEIPGPKMDVTGPFIEGEEMPLIQMPQFKGKVQVKSAVDYWAQQGATSFKIYNNVTREELQTAIETAHSHGHKITGHLCSVTFEEAADLGIDNLEHGLLTSTDFVSDKEPDQCPRSSRVYESLLKLSVDGPEIQGLIKKLIEEEVAITSTLTIFETFVPGRKVISDAELDVLQDDVREKYQRSWSKISTSGDSTWIKLFQMEMDFEYAFVKAGGTLLAGTDPTGFGGVVPGFANQHAVELLVESGFTPLEAIKISTYEGARFLEVPDQTGTLEQGKKADLIVLKGDPSKDISNIKNVQWVFKNGIGYNPQRLIDSVQGKAGLY